MLDRFYNLILGWLFKIKIFTDKIYGKFLASLLFLIILTLFIVCGYGIYKYTFLNFKITKALLYAICFPFFLFLSIFFIRVLSDKKLVETPKLKNLEKEAYPKDEITIEKSYMQLKLTNDLRPRDLANYLLRIYKDGNKLEIESFVAKHFITNRKETELRLKEKTEKLPPINDINLKFKLIEFFWLLHKKNMIEGSFAHICEFLNDTFGEKIGKQTSLTNLPSANKKNFEKSYEGEYSFRKFFDKHGY